MSLFTKRSESELGSDFEWATRPGTYLAEVTEAFDSRVVYPKNAADKRYIGVTVKIYGLIQDDGESAEDFADRHDQVGKMSRPRIYITEKALSTSSRILTEIAGKANPPKDFEKKVTVDDTDPDNPVFDLKAYAEHAPINPGQLVGRRFRCGLQLGNNGKTLQLNPFKTWMVPEDEQEVPARDVFEGEDTVSIKVFERMQKSAERKAKNGFSRSDGLSQQFDDDNDDVAETAGIGASLDKLPF